MKERPFNNRVFLGNLDGPPEEINYTTRHTSKPESNKHKASLENEGVIPTAEDPEKINTQPEQAEHSPEQGAETPEAPAERVEEAVDRVVEDGPGLVSQIGEQQNWSADRIEAATVELKSKSGREKLAEKIKAGVGKMFGGTAAGFISGVAVRTAVRTGAYFVFPPSFVMWAVAGAVSGAAVEAGKKIAKERKKENVDEVLAELSKETDSVTKAAQVAKAKEVLKRDSFTGDRTALDLATHEAEVKLRMKLESNEIEGSTDRQKIIHILKASRAYRSERVSREAKKEAKQLLKEVQFLRHEDKIRWNKVGRAALKGAAVGAIGGVLGGTLAGWLSEKAVNVARVAKDHISPDLLNQKFEQVLAGTQGLAKEVRAKFAQQRITAVAEHFNKGDGFIKLSRHFLHDKLSGDLAIEQMAGNNPPGEISAARLEIAANYLSEHLDKTYALEHAGHHIPHPGEKMSLPADKIQEAWNYALSQSDKNVADMDKFIAHRISKSTLEWMSHLNPGDTSYPSNLDSITTAVNEHAAAAMGSAAELGAGNSAAASELVQQVPEAAKLSLWKLVAAQFGVAAAEQWALDNFGGKSKSGLSRDHILEDLEAPLENESQSTTAEETPVVARTETAETLPVNEDEKEFTQVTVRSDIPIPERKQDELFDLGKVHINGGEFTDYQGHKRMLTPELLRSAGLYPVREIEVGSANIAFSKPYEAGDGRLAVVAYVKGGGQDYTARTYYRSNSTGLWRYLPSYRPDGSGGINHFNKGFGEESITVPSEVQQVLAKMSGPGGEILQISNPDFYFAGTAKSVDQISAEQADITYVREVGKDPKKLPGEVGEGPGGDERLNPEQINVEEAFRPDFSKIKARWQQTSEVYGTPDGQPGNITIELFESNNGEMRYMFCHDQLGRVWIGAVETTGDVGSTGLRRNWVDGGDLTTPASEYSQQAGSYGNENLRRGNYVDMWENYNSKIPLIQEYVNYKRQHVAEEQAAPEEAEAAPETEAPEARQYWNQNLVDELEGEGSYEEKNRHIQNVEGDELKKARNRRRLERKQAGTSPVTEIEQPVVEESTVDEGEKSPIEDEQYWAEQLTGIQERVGAEFGGRIQFPTGENEPFNNFSAADQYQVYRKVERALQSLEPGELAQYLDRLNVLMLGTKKQIGENGQVVGIPIAERNKDKEWIPTKESLSDFQDNLKRTLAEAKEQRDKNLPAAAEVSPPAETAPKIPAVESPPLEYEFESSEPSPDKPLANVKPMRRRETPLEAAPPVETAQQSRETSRKVEAGREVRNNRELNEWYREFSGATGDIPRFFVNSENPSDTWRVQQALKDIPADAWPKVNNIVFDNVEFNGEGGNRRQVKRNDRGGYDRNYYISISDKTTRDIKGMLYRLNGKFNQSRSQVEDSSVNPEASVVQPERESSPPQNTQERKQNPSPEIRPEPVAKAEKEPQVNPTSFDSLKEIFPQVEKGGVRGNLKFEDEATEISNIYSGLRQALEKLKVEPTFISRIIIGNKDNFDIDTKILRVNKNGSAQEISQNIEEALGKFAKTDEERIEANVDKLIKSLFSNVDTDSLPPVAEKTTPLEEKDFVPPASETSSEVREGISIAELLGSNGLSDDEINNIDSFVTNIREQLAGTEEFEGALEANDRKFLRNLRNQATEITNFVERIAKVKRERKRLNPDAVKRYREQVRQLQKKWEKFIKKAS
jgi:hypothetical protein